MEANEWNKLDGQEDMNALMAVYGAFHDSCIKEMRFVGNGFVSDDLSMGITDAARLRVIFQRQWESPAAIELEFIGVEKINLGVSDMHFPDIFEASLFIQGDKVYWANDGEWQPDKSPEYPYTVWICAKSARWRALENGLGAMPFYASPFGTRDDEGELFSGKKSKGNPLN